MLGLCQQPIFNLFCHIYGLFCRCSTSSTALTRYCHLTYGKRQRRSSDVLRGNNVSGNNAMLARYSHRTIPKIGVIDTIAHETANSKLLAHCR